MRIGCRTGKQINWIFSVQVKVSTVSSFILVWLPDNEETEQRTSLTMCQLKDGLEHAFQTGLICVYLKGRSLAAVVTSVGAFGWAAPILNSRCRQQTQLHLVWDRSDGQQLIKGNPEPVRLALVPQGLVMEGNISACRANTHPLFI